MKKTVFLLISVMFFFTLSTPAFSADIDGCTVDRTGVIPIYKNIDLKRSEQAVFLSHPTEWTGSRLFILSTDLGNTGLATFLTAMALEKTVYVRIDSSSSREGSLISIVWANNW